MFVGGLVIFPTFVKGLQFGPDSPEFHEEHTDTRIYSAKFVESKVFPDIHYSFKGALNLDFDNVEIPIKQSFVQIHSTSLTARDRQRNGPFIPVLAGGES